MQNLKSREFFLQYSRNPGEFGLMPDGHSYYNLDRPGLSPIRVRSMLSTHEIALLYSLAKNVYQSGAVVDLGPLLGASTWAFARGISEAGHDTASLHSFDLWRAEGSYDSYLKKTARGGGGSILGAWARVISPWLDRVEPHQGDFLDWTWDGREIGILFVDIAKSWALNNHVVSTMFPALRPGSILVQQDYIRKKSIYHNYQALKEAAAKAEIPILNANRLRIMTNGGSGN